VAPCVKAELEKLENNSWELTVGFCGDSLFEVTEGKTMFIVNLEERTCDCKHWQISGIPCKHSIRCILHM